MRRWIRRWLARRQEDSDLSEELRAHLAIEAQQRMEAGEPPGRRRAPRGAHLATSPTFRRTFASRGDGPESSASPRMFASDCACCAGHPSGRRPISAMLALGVGLSTAIFSVVYGVLLQPLALSECGPAGGPMAHGDEERLCALQRQRRALARLAEELDAARGHCASPGPSRISISPARALRSGCRGPARRSTFRWCWVRPRCWAGYSPKQEQLADAQVALLSHAFWTTRFGGDPGILGRKIQLNGEPFEVIGVMPPEYRYPSADFELWTPLYIPPGEIRHGMNHQYISVGRIEAWRAAWNRRRPSSPPSCGGLRKSIPPITGQATNGSAPWSNPWRRAMPSRCAARYTSCWPQSGACC